MAERFKDNPAYRISPVLLDVHSLNSCIEEFKKSFGITTSSIKPVKEVVNNATQN